MAERLKPPLSRGPKAVLAEIVLLLLQKARIKQEWSSPDLRINLTF
jgi:hypothetical protein